MQSDAVYTEGNVGIGMVPVTRLDVQRSDSGIAIRGANTLTTSSTAVGVQGVSAGNVGSGVWGIASHPTGSGRGVFGQAAGTGGMGVQGSNTATSGTGWGVYGDTSSPTGYGVYGVALSNSGVTYGVYGRAPSTSGFAVFAEGRTGASGSKSFQIDHPRDPANKHINHFCAEGPQPYNVYTGNAVLDAAGRATVNLPDYFGDINTDFRYQLTPIGAPALVYIASEIENNTFTIAGGQPGMKVSWTVTALRNDPWVRANPMADVTEKPASQKGTYLHPELFGQPDELRTHRGPAAPPPAADVPAAAPGLVDTGAAAAAPQVRSGGAR